MARIVLHPFGSFGDLHPFLGLSIELKKRGHEPVIATAAVYREKIAAEGIGFHPVQPDLGQFIDNPDLIRKVWDRRRGTEYLLCEIIFPVIEASYNDLMETAQDADLLVTHTAGFAGPLVAERLHKRWLSVALQPIVFFSRLDPPVISGAEWLRHTYGLTKLPFALLRMAAKWQTRSWIGPLVRLRRQIGLGEAANPIIAGQFSPYGTLALFSECFAQAQADWPPATEVSGFVFYDKLGAGFGQLEGDASALEHFLADGSPPLVFTLGSSAVMHPQRFFEESALAAERLGVRAVLIAGRQAVASQSKNVLTVPYARYSELFARARALVHQGGIGTTAQALRAGKPMLVVPWAHDQPDNAFRLEKLGVARTLARRRYRAASATEELRRLLGGPGYESAARSIAERMLRENGVSRACDRIETLLLRH